MLLEFQGHQNTRCNSTPTNASGSVTPNRRLNSWAESRNLSIDTDTIVARDIERQREKLRRLEELRRRKELRPESQSTQSSGGGERRRVMSCFAFLCRRANY